MTTLVSKMFCDDDVKEQIEFDNCVEQRVDEDVGTEEELIDLVKACPILYDVRLKVYKDRGMKDRAWRSVAEAMKLNVLETKNKWKNIRDAYVKYLHACKEENSTPGRKTKKRYKFADKMQFLDKCIQHRNPPSNYTRQKRDSASHNNSLSMVVNYTDDQRDGVDQLQQLETSDVAQVCNQQLIDSSSSEKSTTGMSKQLLNSKCGLVDGKHVKKKKFATDSIPDPSQPSGIIDENDDSKLFCLSLISTMKRLDDKKRQLAKLKIQNALYEVEFSD